MIYIHPSDSLHTPERQSDFNFSQYLKGFNAVLRKSLLVSINYKEKKVIPQSFISKMS